MISIELKHDTDEQCFFIQLSHAATRIGQSKHVVYSYGGETGVTADQACELAYAAMSGAIQTHKMMLDAMNVSHNQSDILRMKMLAREIDQHEESQE